MKALPSLVAIGIMLSAACYAQRCPDPKSQQAAIVGDTINGYVSLQQRPLKSAQVRLLSDGKTIWVGSTDKTGSFQIKGLRRGTYRLTVKGWGSAIIRINPDLSKPCGNGQTPIHIVWLADSECIWTVTVMN
ncbi:MAG TPA: carboxypeptidase-like regulatory domain-containing protein [Terracidiphilus sp.]|nr:carboxypeptidase-like regulatory domain-containing protein [Terracidiphilus sp.]